MPNEQIPPPLTCSCWWFTSELCWRVRQYLSVDISKPQYPTADAHFLPEMWTGSSLFFVPPPTVLDSSDTILIIDLVSPSTVLFICYTWFISQAWTIQEAKQGRGSLTDITIGQPCLLLVKVSTRQKKRLTFLAAMLVIWTCASRIW